MVATPEDELMYRARRGDAGAFGELMQKYQTSVFNVCFRLLGERREAEDQTQEAFLRAYQRLATFEEGRPFGPWIRKVAANLCINHLQTRHSLLVSLDEERDSIHVNKYILQNTSQDQSDVAEDLFQALMGLAPHYRAVIELRHYQNMTYSEIAQALNLPMSDVKSHLFRARKILVERLKHDS